LARREYREGVDKEGVEVDSIDTCGRGTFVGSGKRSGWGSKKSNPGTGGDPGTGGYTKEVGRRFATSMDSQSSGSKKTQKSKEDDRKNDDKWDNDWGSQGWSSGNENNWGTENWSGNNNNWKRNSWGGSSWGSGRKERETDDDEDKESISSHASIPGPENGATKKTKGGETLVFDKASATWYKEGVSRTKVQADIEIVDKLGKQPARDSSSKNNNKKPEARTAVEANKVESEGVGGPKGAAEGSKGTKGSSTADVQGKGSKGSQTNNVGESNWKTEGECSRTESEGVFSDVTVTQGAEGDYYYKQTVTVDWYPISKYSCLFTLAEGDEAAAEAESKSAKGDEGESKSTPEARGSKKPEDEKDGSLYQ
jgi:hypothetical protein